MREEELLEELDPTRPEALYDPVRPLPVEVPVETWRPEEVEVPTPVAGVVCVVRARESTGCESVPEVVVPDVEGR